MAAETVVASADQGGNAFGHRSDVRTMTGLGLFNHFPYYLRLLGRIPNGVLRRVTRRSCRGWPIMRPYVEGKHGLEIGGPSRIFCAKHLIPVYRFCERIDACNFARDNIWSELGDEERFGTKLGEKFVAEACCLSMIRDETYDFVLASHVLEHTANPVRALQEWKRVLKLEGVLLVVVPDKHVTFDRRRAFTSFDHIEADFQRNTSEDDLTHLDEVLAQHDLRLDPPAGSREEFRERCLRNHTVRAMHHHVFCRDVLERMFGFLQMQVLTLAIERPDHIIGFARKTKCS